MNARTFKYFFQEGIKSFFKNGLMSIASVITVTLCLVLFGVYVLFSLNLNYVITQVETNYKIQVFIDENANDSRVEQIHKNLSSISNINNVLFVSKEEALQEWKKQFGDNAQVLDGLENDNPLRDSYKVTMKDLQLVDETVSQIKSISDIASVKNNKQVMDKLLSITKTVKNVSFWLMIFFALISIFIISNAIRITVFARRREVNIMKFVGATDWFISFPFMIEGMAIGFLGALVSLLAVTQAYVYFTSVVNILIENSFKIYQLSSILGIVSAALVGMGIVLGAVGSVISLRRHLHV